MAQPTKEHPRAGADPAPPRPTHPVTWFAVIGALVLAVQAYAWSRWALSGQMTPAPAGPTPIPGWMELLARISEILNFTGGLAVLGWFVLRPWIREKRLTLDGMLVIIWIQMWLLQDPIQNWTVNNFAYNVTFVNLGSWTSSLPGWVAPDSYKMGEPLLWGLGAYAVGMFLPMLLCCALLRKVRQRRPSIGTAGLIGIAVAAMGVFLIILETFWVRTGQYSYMGVVRSLSLWPGTYYQYPMYSWLAWSVFWGLLVALRFFRDDRGQTIAERGIEHLRLTPRRTQAVRFLALVGLCNLMYAFLYCLPLNLFATHVDAFPRDVLDRSYLTSGLCGLGTDRACSDPRFPTPREGSAYVSPDGHLVLPGERSGS
jgi:hypothetical protein